MEPLQDRQKLRPYQEQKGLFRSNYTGGSIESSTLSTPMAFMTSATASRGVRRTSGSLCSGKLSLKCADEYSLRYGVQLSPEDYDSVGYHVDTKYYNHSPLGPH